MHEIIINGTYGGFSLSRKATERLAELGFEPAAKYLQEYKEDCSYEFSYYPYYSELPRHHPLLVQVVKELGSAVAGGKYSNFTIECIDSDLYYIKDYDGSETIMTPENTEWIVIKKE